MLPDQSELQLLFARFNALHFGGVIPPYRIAYNGRFGNLAGRIRFRPPLIELSRRHFERSPERLPETLLHEMIHAWLHVRGEKPGHGATFKAKMRELGMTSIRHDLGSIPARNESPRRFILRCDACTAEVLRKRKPRGIVACARCCRGRFDARYAMRVLEVTSLREA